jgi:hypothetical protein
MRVNALFERLTEKELEEIKREDGQVMLQNGEDMGLPT